jgi:hypothetical protein
MGLSLIVGILADLKDQDEEGAEHYRAQFEAVNQALKAEKLPIHQEPETLESSYSGDMFGYSALHHLRKIAAFSWAGFDLPTPWTEDPTKDPIVQEYYDSLGERKPSLLSRFFGKPRLASPRYDHLMFHSDAEGYYLPQDFDAVIYPHPRLKIAGGMIGSSVHLKKECESLARLLELPLDLDPESDEVLEAVEEPGKASTKWKSYAKACHACLRLWGACDFSLKNRAAIVFA